MCEMNSGTWYQPICSSLLQTKYAGNATRFIGYLNRMKQNIYSKLPYGRVYPMKKQAVNVILEVEEG
jgi:hypothetical protein